MIDDVVGNYKILEKIGEGGMGEVFKGIDLMVDRQVAIKSLRPELAQTGDRRALSQRGVRAREAEPSQYRDPL